MSRWDKPGVPHKGWTCVGVNDIRDQGQSVDDTVYETCEMCGNERIRFVHIMEHTQYGETLSVGCVCAERMTDDYVNPKLREERLKSKSGRRARWLSRKWKMSKKGHKYLDIDGIYVTVFPDKFYPDKWKFCVGKTPTDRKFSILRYGTSDEAKMGAFEEVWERLAG